MSHRVVHIDDDEISLRITRQTLQRAGFTTVSTRSHQVFDLCKIVERTMPSLLLVDDQMPAMGGSQLVSFFRQRSRHQCPVLLYSGATSEGDLADKARICGANGYVLKTPDLGQLVREVSCRLGGAADSPLDPLMGGSSKVRHLFMLERRTGRAGFVEDFVMRFLDVLEDRVVCLLAATTGGNAEGVRHHAHFIKVNAEKLGSTRLSLLCEQLERESPRVNEADFRELVQRLPAESHRFRDWITDALARESNRPAAQDGPSASDRGRTGGFSTHAAAQRSDRDDPPKE